MGEHSHREYVEGCYRCDLSRDEVQPADRPDVEAIARRLANGYIVICDACGEKNYLTLAEYDRTTKDIAALIAYVRELEADNERQEDKIQNHLWEALQLIAHRSRPPTGDHNALIHQIATAALHPQEQSDE